MAINDKLTARIPIILDDLNNRQDHKDKEMVFDYQDEDIYIKRGNTYVNITGSIKDTVEEIKDGSMILHIVSEENLPAIKDRPKNNWYLVVTKTENYDTGKPIDSRNSIYYGVINDEYYEDKSYLLIAQNMIIDPSVVKMRVIDGYRACFYVPTELEPTFFNDETGEQLTFTTQDRLYALTADGAAISYDVYISEETGLGDIFVQVQFTSINWLTVNIESNDTNVTGLEFPLSEIRVVDGTVIGYIPDPIWTAPRYIFKGWSLKKAQYDPIDPITYILEDNITLYAYFEYDDDMTKYEYKIIYASSTNAIIGTFYSVAAPGTVLTPKPFTGYTTPTDSVTLNTNDQTVRFTYQPISYNITYLLDGGELTGQKTSYTIEEAYIPPTPYKEGFTFERWSPRRINKGTTGSITFSAIWNSNATFVAASVLRSAILSLHPGIESTMTTIERSSDEPLEGYQNVSSTGDPIYIWYVPATTTLKYYTPYGISCNINMSGVFENFIHLLTITSLSDWEINPDTNISNMFKNCTLLSELAPLEPWNLTGGNFGGAFDHTAANSAGRLPSWYIWDYTIRYITSDNHLLREESANKIPGTKFVPTPSTPIEGYTVPTDEKTLTENGQIFTIVCTPI